MQCGGSAGGPRFSLEYYNRGRTVADGGVLHVAWGDGDGWQVFYSNFDVFYETNKWYHVAVTTSSAGRIETLC